jgi:ubiquinone/menaquinone biosynthesis C-methylase UbiE
MSEAPKNQVQTRFGQHAAAYVTSTTHAQGSELGRLLELAQPQSDWTVLDVATGGGHMALTLAPLVKQVIAADLTLPMLHAAQQHLLRQGAYNVQFAAGDAEALPFASGKFHCVTNRIAAHHFPDPFRFVQEVYRVLQPQGVFLLQDIVLPDERQAAQYVDAFEILRDPSHHRAYAQYEWEGMCLDAGLQIEHAEVIRKQHHLVDWAQRQGCDEATIEHLQVLLLQAPAPVREWLAPQHAGNDCATFYNRHLLLLGRKPDG